MSEMKNNLISFEDYKREAGIKDLKSFRSSYIDASEYVKEVRPTCIDKYSVRLNLLTVNEYSKVLSSEVESECKAIEAQIESKSFYSLARKCSNC